ncbi:MAG TPA: transglycosylase domain-containing protein [Gaiellaceae bacterium]|jgi:penicillin-binding protein 1A
MTRTPRRRSGTRDTWLEDRRRRKRRRQKRRATSRRGLWIVLAFGLVLLVLIAAGIGGTAAFGASCDLRSLRPVAIGQNSFVYAADGTLLGSIPAERNRTPVTRSQISPWMARATVAIEDRRFYSHGGVDYEGIVRALVADIRAGKVVQGGSTITQQLVRNLYISREQTLQRKLREACLAIKLSRHWSKSRILTAYMNQVYYGNHAYGIEAAAETYFSKRARELTLEEAALLSGLPQAPSVYDPFHRPADALARRNQVLRALLASGDITSSRYARAVRGPLGLEAGRRYTRIREPYFFTYVEDELQQEYGANTVRSGGLRVYTTIVPRVQRAANVAIRGVLTYSSDPSSAIVAIDPRNGAIRAMTAVTPGRSGNAFNLVSQARRQPGSTFKTIVLATAVADGVDPDSTYYLSAPFHYQPDPTCNPRDPGCAWDVTTYDHTYLGSTSLTNATIHSDNTVYARLILDVGPEDVAETAYKLGVRTSPLDPVPSLTLGSIGVSPLEMASVYATLAAGGVYSKPTAITRVVLANGKTDTDAGWGKPRRERVIPDWVAAAVTRVLEQNMLHGTGVGAYFGRTAAGKTGTTDNYADAWFCGYVPQLEATVWVGYPRAEVPMLNVHGIAVSGPTFPAQIWRSFMEASVGNTPQLDFPRPSGAPRWQSWHGQYEFGRPSGTVGSATSPAPATAPTAPLEETTTTAPTAVAPATSAEQPPVVTTDETVPVATTSESDPPAGGALPVP